MTEKEPPTQEELTSTIVRWISEEFQREVTADSDFVSLGLDSFDLVRLADVVAARLGVDEIAITTVFENPTASQLASKLMESGTAA